MHILCYKAPAVLQAPTPEYCVVEFMLMQCPSRLQNWLFNLQSTARQPYVGPLYGTAWHLWRTQLVGVSQQAAACKTCSCSMAGQTCPDPQLANMSVQTSNVTWIYTALSQLSIQLCHAKMDCCELPYNDISCDHAVLTLRGYGIASCAA